MVLFSHFPQQKSSSSAFGKNTWTSFAEIYTYALQLCQTYLKFRQWNYIGKPRVLCLHCLISRRRSARETADITGTLFTSPWKERIGKDALLSRRRRHLRGLLRTTPQYLASGGTILSLVALRPLRAILSWQLHNACILYLIKYFLLSFLSLYYIPYNRFSMAAEHNKEKGSKSKGGICVKQAFSRENCAKGDFVSESFFPLLPLLFLLLSEENPSGTKKRIWSGGH